MEDCLDQISIILIKTSHPGNIGSTARAMKVMGLKNLILVSPKEFPSKKADALASGAVDILENAKVVDNLDEALENHHLVLATSARSRTLQWPVLSPKEAAVKSLEFIINNNKLDNNKISNNKINNKVAILFGEERIGLENDALACAHYHLIIPTSKAYSSLNLSQAVQVISYAFFEQALELFNKNYKIKSKNLDPQDELAEASLVKGLMDHLDKLMVETEFVDPKQPKQLRLRLQLLFQRAQLTLREVNILRGICAAALRYKNVKNCEIKK